MYGVCDIQDLTPLADKTHGNSSANKAYASLSDGLEIRETGLRNH